MLVFVVVAILFIFSFPSYFLQSKGKWHKFSDDTVFTSDFLSTFIESFHSTAHNQNAGIAFSSLFSGIFSCHYCFSLFYFQMRLSIVERTIFLLDRLRLFCSWQNPIFHSSQEWQRCSIFTYLGICCQLKSWLKYAGNCYSHTFCHCPPLDALFAIYCFYVFNLIRVHHYHWGTTLAK